MGRPDVVRQATTDTVIRPMDTVVCGVAHGRARLLRDEDWFLPELRAFPMITVCGGRAPMCSQGGLRTWEPDHGHKQPYYSA